MIRYALVNEDGEIYSVCNDIKAVEEFIAKYPNDFYIGFEADNTWTGKVFLPGRHVSLD